MNPMAADDATLVCTCYRGGPVSPEVSKVLDAVEAGLSDDNLALLGSNLTRRAFVLGVASTLSQFYSDPESQQVLGRYMLKTLTQTMLKS